MGQKSQVKGFNKGLVTDSDPRLQLDGTYRDAMNIKVINVDGSTFTVENINGNRKLIDLTDTEIFGKSDYLYNGSPVTTSFQYNYFTPRTNANGDNQINVLDVITTMNIVLTNGSYNTCSDLNTDGAINVLDVVALVNLILSSEN